MCSYVVCYGCHIASRWIRTMISVDGNRYRGMAKVGNMYLNEGLTFTSRRRYSSIARTLLCVEIGERAEFKEIAVCPFPERICSLVPCCKVYIRSWSAFVSCGRYVPGFDINAASVNMHLQPRIICTVQNFERSSTLHLIMQYRHRLKLPFNTF